MSPPTHCTPCFTTFLFYTVDCCFTISQASKNGDARRLNQQADDCRERKRAQLQTLAARTLALEQENAHLKEALVMRDTEVAGLRDKLASLTRGAGGNSWTASASEPAVLSGASSSMFLSSQCQLFVEDCCRPGLNFSACGQLCTHLSACLRCLHLFVLKCRAFLSKLL